MVPFVTHPRLNPRPLPCSRHLGGFAQAIWNRLLTLTQATKYDQLASASIRFLTNVVSKQHYMHLFGNQESLEQIVQQVSCQPRHEDLNGNRRWS